MFEIPEYVTLARQMAESLSGKRIAEGTLGNSPHKFVWYNREPAEFAAIVKGKTIGEAYCRGRWLFIPLQPGYVLVFGECGGKIILHESESQLPKKYHLSLHFEDGSFLSATTQMWGAMELYEKGDELERQYIKGMRTAPVDPEFSLEYLSALIEECTNKKSRSVKGPDTRTGKLDRSGYHVQGEAPSKAAHSKLEQGSNQEFTSSHCRDCGRSDPAGRQK